MSKIKPILKKKELKSPEELSPMRIKRLEPGESEIEPLYN